MAHDRSIPAGDMVKEVIHERETIKVEHFFLK